MHIAQLKNLAEMILLLLRAFRSQNSRTRVKFTSAFELSHPIPISQNLLKSSTSVYSICQRPFSLLSAFHCVEDLEPTSSKEIDEKYSKSKKSLDIFFKEAVGLTEQKFFDIETLTEGDNAELKKKLRKLEVELGNLKVKKKYPKVIKDDEKEVTRNNKGTSKYEPGQGTLSALFRKKRDDSMPLTMENTDARKKSLILTMDDSEDYKDLSIDMQLFANFLYMGGYFKDANFLPRNKFDVTCFENSYSRDFLRFAAEQFGKDNQEIAKWLSGTDLKKVVLFGCPSLGRKTVFSAKRLRTYFSIKENIVCSKCHLKESCKFVNQSVWKGDTKNLNLAVVMRVITLYAMETVPPNFKIPDEIRDSVSRLIREVINLSKTLS